MELVALIYKIYAFQYFRVYTVELVVLLGTYCRLIYTFLSLGIFLCLLTCPGILLLNLQMVTASLVYPFSR